MISDMKYEFGEIGVEFGEVFFIERDWKWNP
jgi:hypothetical protein